VQCVLLQQNQTFHHACFLYYARRSNVTGKKYLSGPTYQLVLQRERETLSFNSVFPLFYSEMAGLLVAWVYMLSAFYHILLLYFIGAL